MRVKGVLAGRLVVRLGLFVDGKAVGELGTVVGQHGVDVRVGSAEKAGEKAGCGDGAAIGQDLEIDKAGGAVDRDVGVAAAAVERRQVFDVDVNEAGRGVDMKRGRRGFLPGQAGRDPVPLQAAVDGAARQLGIEAASHRFDNVVERQGEAAAQLHNQGLLPRRHGGVQPVPARRVVGRVLAGFPPRHGAVVDAEFARQGDVGGLAFRDVGAGARGGGGVGMQPEVY